MTALAYALAVVGACALVVILAACALVWVLTKNADAFNRHSTR